MARRCKVLLALLVFTGLGALNAPADPPVPGAGSHWRPTFSDEFNDTSLDTTRWVVENAAPSHILSGRWPENIVVENGILRLLTKKEVPPRGGKDWSTGNLWTRSFKQRYGYWEARYKIGAASGLNNAFWGIKSGNFEIDINEGHYPDEINMTLHDWRQTPATSTSKQYYAGVNLSQGYHTYGLQWTENELIWYLDGTVLRRISHNFCNTEIPVYLSSAVLAWAGTITDALDGTSMDVDWVRLYEKAVDWTSSTLSFGEVGIRSTQGKRTSVAIVNNTAGTLNITGVTLGGTDAAAFSVDSSGLSTLAAGQTGYFAVTFKPTTLGAKSARVQIGSNYPGRASTTINLLGSGVSGVIYVSPSGNDGNSGQSWGQALKTPAKAPGVAGSKDFSDIWIRGGTYSNATLTLSSGMRVYGGFSGGETGADQRNMNEIFGANKTVLLPAAGARAIDITDADHITVDGLTLQGSRNVIWGGGGIKVTRAGDITIANCLLSGNGDDAATGKGAGLCLVGSADHPVSATVTNCHFLNNLNTGGGGGGGVQIAVYARGDFSHCVIRGNRTETETGGGLMMQASTGYTSTFSDCTFSNNQCGTRGGGAFVSGNAVFRNCTFAGNRTRAGTADKHGGAGLYVDGSSQVTVEGCIIAGNRAGGAGGSACSGAGLHVQAGTVDLVNGLICGNGLAGAVAHRGGGASFVTGSGTLTNCTIADNETSGSAEAGGIVTWRPVTLRNTLLAGNSGPARAVLSSGSFSETANLYFGNGLNGAPVGNPHVLMNGRFALSGNWSAVGPFTADALTQNGTTLLTAAGTPFAGMKLEGRLLLANAGRRLQALILANTASTLLVEGDVRGDCGAAPGVRFKIADYRLCLGSAALDAAKATFAPAVDLAGKSRPVGAGYDIGAYEGVQAYDAIGHWERVYSNY